MGARAVTEGHPGRDRRPPTPSAPQRERRRRQDLGTLEGRRWGAGRPKTAGQAWATPINLCGAVWPCTPAGLGGWEFAGFIDSKIRRRRPSAPPHDGIATSDAPIPVSTPQKEILTDNACLTAQPSPVEPG